ncbi:hypothetical protein N0V93_003049 [Gnomoniopsis smithogilvyi]|uniref:X-Pro dipeptidyl-peptidase n=1 Tax=Gnomoniopsis smithogilvyi TaxID=1191159 RepID=A0A9W8YXL0_9PEZI|nr:hypothetical protein N0V93_003049 [Gnomoniopsis smithogilvyi]
MISPDNNAAKPSASVENDAHTSPAPRERYLETDWEVVGVSEDNEEASLGKSPVRRSASVGSSTMQDRILRIRLDERELDKVWTVQFSQNRHDAFLNLYKEELANLHREAPFATYNQEERIDYLLFQNYLKRHTRRLQLEQKRDWDTEPLLPFAPALVSLCEARIACRFEILEPSHIASVMHDATTRVFEITSQVKSGKVHVSKEAAYRAMKNIEHLKTQISDLYAFFNGYNPTFDWWVKAPYASLEKALQSLLPAVATNLAGIRPDDKDEIIGQPIGRDGLLVELEAEMIPYSPAELLSIANDKYAWCEKEMRKAASELGFGSDWKAALRHVQNIYVEPGKQPQLIKSLVDSAAAYVKKNDLVTVPPLAEKWTMSMMSPAMQKVNPFFLGGPKIIVSYPTVDMAHSDKLMSMRGNGPHLSKATAFHEMIPGHHLQGFVGGRSHAYRNLFDTPFYVEGWAMYWELVFWDRGDFFASPEDRVGTLFWRMHRCARILFSLKFHLGQLTPQQCVDLLVEMVGHERATAEGEVRRSLNGDYGPLYQAGYYLGAMQLYALRQEVLSKGILGEKAFHDCILQANQMPIELLRALILGEDLSRDYKSKWKFYGDNVSPLVLRGGL